MPIYKAPLEDVSFLLNDVFQVDRYDNLPGFSDASADVREAILAEAAKLSEEVLQPLNRVGDLEGCTRHDDGSVTTPKGFKEAFKQVAEGGWLGLSAPAEYGGQGLAGTISLKTSSISCWLESRARRPGSRACRCSWCRRSWSMPTGRWERATACPAARSNTRWVSTAIPPA